MLSRGSRILLLAAGLILLLPGCVVRQAVYRTPERDALIEEIRRFKGAPYRYGGSTPKGTDCSGFTMTVFRRFGVNLPHGAKSQYQMGKPVAFTSLKMGDLVFFRTGKSRNVNHVGIYLWDGKMVHASSSYGVIVEPFVSSSYWEPRYVGARRIVDF